MKTIDCFKKRRVRIPCGEFLFLSFFLGIYTYLTCFVVNLRRRKGKIKKLNNGGKEKKKKKVRKKIEKKEEEEK